MLRIEWNYHFCRQASTWQITNWSSGLSFQVYRGVINGYLRMSSYFIGKLDAEIEINFLDIAYCPVQNE